MLNAKADPEARGAGGHTPLMLSAMHGHESIAVLLIAVRAQVEAAMADGTTALHIASRFGHCDVARQLLDAGARPEAKTKNGMSASQLAWEGSHQDVVELLSQRSSSKKAAKDKRATPDRMRRKSVFATRSDVRFLAKSGSSKSTAKPIQKKKAR